MSKTQRIVVALGGNALGDNLDEQMRAAKVAATAIADLIEAGNQVVLVHGNGPQVGMIEQAFEAASKAGEDFPLLPMSVCVALSQGYIGYDLQNVLRRELDARGNAKPVATIISQTVVDPADPAFNHPSKPIGSFMSREEAERLEDKGVAVMEDSGRGWRQVVASPLPLAVVEAPVVCALLEAGQVPIAGGGGGIPVAKIDGQYRGMGAIVDKDFVAATLATEIDASMLVILTAIENVCINFGTPEQQQLDLIDTAQAQRYLDEGQFGKGSMEPKVRAAMRFVQQGGGKTALITQLECARAALDGTTGTRIVA
jgi:carbamate kinase